MSRYSVRDPGRFAATPHSFQPHIPCGPIEPVLPAVLRSVIFLATLALPFVIALYAA